VPKARIEAVRTAFAAMVKDPAFLASAKKRRIAIVPLAGEKVQVLIEKTVNVSPSLVARAKKALGYK
jgi:Mg-chelatase subunit ChlD